MAIQGPKSFELMKKVFGKKITELKFFGFNYFDFEGTKHLIARSGWSKQGGYEVYVQNTTSGQKLYDQLSKGIIKSYLNDYEIKKNNFPYIVKNKGLEISI